ncbi:hypothetical protein KSP40_PGU016742 [Platanthera guangdongensis]|uniref:Uncharacterized protein n=1 Tax=Platanthera guangdongensis TaxID=2320717 RepID=A0ABR2MX55_9ASPA
MRSLEPRAQLAQVKPLPPCVQEANCARNPDGKHKEEAVKRTVCNIFPVRCRHVSFSFYLSVPKEMLPVLIETVLYIS